MTGTFQLKKIKIGRLILYKAGVLKLFWLATLKLVRKINLATLKESYDPLNVKNTKLNKNFLLIKFGDPFRTFGDPQKGHDP